MTKLNHTSNMTCAETLNFCGELTRGQLEELIEKAEKLEAISNHKLLERMWGVLIDTSSLKRVAALLENFLENASLSDDQDGALSLIHENLLDAMAGLEDDDTRLRNQLYELTDIIDA